MASKKYHTKQSSPCSFALVYRTFNDVAEEGRAPPRKQRPGVEESREEKSPSFDELRVGLLEPDHGSGCTFESEHFSLTNLSN